MDIDLVNAIKRITLIALASDDELVETLVLKGGNAIDLAYSAKNGNTSRASYDLDYSLDNGDFSEDEIIIAERIKATLTQTFLENEYILLDYKFSNRPKSVRDELASFWGGYKVEFKIIEKKKFDANRGNIDKLRRDSITLNPDHSPVFEIEFSKFEYVGQKVPINVDGYKIYVYAPEMIVFEKLRAICQQLPGYQEIIPSFSPRARARDFYDIHLIMEMHKINPSTKESRFLINNIFQAKKVPLTFINEIKNNKSIHLDNWPSVKDTISPYEKLESFDYYFEYVLKNFEDLIFP